MRIELRVSVSLHIGDLAILYDRHGRGRHTGGRQDLMGDVVDTAAQLGRKAWLRLGLGFYCRRCQQREENEGNE